MSMGVRQGDSTHFQIGPAYPVEMSEREQADLILGRGGDHVSVWVVGRQHPDSVDFWDGNWLVASVQIAAGGFRGDIAASLRADELRGFRENLERLDQDGAGEAVLKTMENWITLDVRVSPTGRLHVSGDLRDQPGMGNRLSFTLDTDLAISDLTPMIRSLRAIERSFPVQGQP
jgi:hypothetical protein